MRILTWSDTLWRYPWPLTLIHRPRCPHKAVPLLLRCAARFPGLRGACVVMAGQWSCALLRCARRSYSPHYLLFKGTRYYVVQFRGRNGARRLLRTVLPWWRSTKLRSVLSEIQDRPMTWIQSRRLRVTILRFIFNIFLICYRFWQSHSVKRF